MTNKLLNLERTHPHPSVGVSLEDTRLKMSVKSLISTLALTVGLYDCYLLLQAFSVSTINYLSFLN